MKQSHRDAISRAKAGRSRGSHSAETRKKMSDAKSRRYVLISPNGKAYKLDSVLLKRACVVFDLKYAGLMASKLKNRPYKGWVLMEIERTS